MVSTSVRNLSWEETAGILTRECPSTKKRLRLRLLDTVFLHSAFEPENHKDSNGRVRIASWFLTSKKGEATRRKNLEKLTLNHVCERFCRFALANPTNAKGPRFVAIAQRNCGAGCGEDSSCRSYLTAEALKHAVKKSGRGASTLVTGSSSLQCYMRPHQGDDVILRVVIRNDEDSSASDGSDIGATNPQTVDISQCHSSIETFSFESTLAYSDATILSPIVPGQGDFADHIRNELASWGKKIAQHISSFPFNTGTAQHSHTKVNSLTADFVLDDNRELWLCCIPSLCTTFAGQVRNKTIREPRPASLHTLPAISSSSSGPSHETIFRNIHSDKSADLASKRETEQGSCGYQGYLNPDSSLPKIHQQMPVRHIRNTPETKEKRTRTLSPDHMPTGQSGSEQRYVLEKLPSHTDKASLASRKRSGVEGTSAAQFNPPKELSHGSDETAKSLRNRISLLENDIKAVKSKERQARDAAVEASDRCTDLQRQLKTLGRKASGDMQHKDDEYSRSILELESQLNASKAEIAQLKAISAKQGKPVESSSSEANEKPGDHSMTLIQQELLTKLEELHRELTASQQKWTEEKRGIISQHASAQQTLAAKHRADLSELRTVISALEDEVVTQKERLRDVEKERTVLVRKNEESDRKSAQLVNVSEKLKNEMTAMKQNFEAARNKRATTGRRKAADGGGKISEGSQMQALHNKVEYLKAQLASETTLKDDYVSRANALRQEKEVMTVSLQKRLRELGMQKDADISRIKEQMDTSLEGQRQEISNLQETVVSLQTQLGDAMRDTTQARKDEETCRRQMDSERLNVQSLQQELCSAKRDVEEAQTQIQSLKDAGSDATVNEAVLRQLDNENGYIKKQLQNELSCKNDLLEKINAYELRLEETMTAWKSEKDSYDQKLRDEEDKRNSKEADLKGTNQVLQVEVEAQKNQIEELKHSYAKVRDQLRLDQASAEQMRADSAQMAEQLRATQEELTHARSLTEATVARHSENARVISSTLQQAEHIRAKEIAKLQEETHSALTHASETQREMVKLREEVSVQKKNVLKADAARTIFMSLTKSLRMSELRAFYSWIAFMDSCRAHTNSQRALARAVNETKERVSQEWEAKLSIATARIESDKAEQIKDLTASLEEEKKRIIESTQRDAREALDNEQTRLDGHLDQERSKWKEQEASGRRTHEAVIAKIRRECNEQIKATKVEAEESLQKAMLEAECNFHEVQKASIKDCNEKWEGVFAEAKKQYEKEKREALSDVDVHSNKVLTKEREEAAEELLRMRKSTEEKLEQAVRQERLRMESELKKALSESESDSRQRIEESKRDMEKVINELKTSHLEALQLKHTEFADMLVAKEAEWAAIHGKRYASSLQDALDEEKRKRLKEVQEEAAKWQEVVREKESCLESEKEVSFNKGFQDRDKRAKQEIKDLQEAANEALDKVKRSAKERLREALEDSSSRLKLARKQSEEEKDAAVKAAANDAELEKSKLLEAAEQEKARALEEAKKEWLLTQETEIENASGILLEREAAVRKRMEADHEKAILKVKKDQMDTLHQLEQVRLEANAKLEQYKVHYEADAQRQLQGLRQEMEREFQEMLEEKEKAFEQELAETEKRFVTEQEQKLRTVQDTAEIETEKALSCLEDEYKDRLLEVQKVAESTIEQNALSEGKLGVALSLVEEHEDTIYDLQQDVIMRQKYSSFQQLRLVTTAMKLHAKHADDLKRKDDAVKNAIEAEREAAEAKQQSLLQQIEELQNTIEKHNDLHKSMHETLVNHKREVLLEHKTKSKKIFSDLEALSTSRSELENSRARLENDTKEMEDSLCSLEIDIKNHAQTSSIQSGRVNLAHTKKKRRLDAEYEELIEKIEGKRVELSKVDASLRKLLERKEEAEDKMKALERKLVEVLVEQQKRLLSILSSTKAKR